MKKKLFALLLALCMVFSLMPAQSVMAEGSAQLVFVDAPTEVHYAADYTFYLSLENTDTTLDSYPPESILWETSDDSVAHLINYDNSSATFDFCGEGSVTITVSVEGTELTASHTVSIIPDEGPGGTEDDTSVAWFFEEPEETIYAGKPYRYHVITADGSPIEGWVNWSVDGDVNATITIDDADPTYATIIFTQEGTPCVQAANTDGTVCASSSPSVMPAVEWTLTALFEEAFVGQTGQLSLSNSNGSPIEAPLTWTTDEDIYARVTPDEDNYASATVEFLNEGTVTVTVISDEEQLASITITIISPPPEEEMPDEDPGDVPADPDMPGIGIEIPADGDGGELGEGIAWNLTASGVLTVSGSGVIPAFEYQTYGDTGITNAPWGKYCEGITSVVVEEGITGIGEFSFFGLRKVTSVSLPSTLTTIAPHSLQHMESLTAIAIPDSVQSIGGYAFYSTPLEDLTIPTALKQIGALGFSPVDNLYIDTLEHWLAIEFIPDDYGDYDWANPTDENTKFHIGGKLVTELTIPEGTTKIGPYKFWNLTTLTKVTIPDSVTEIGEGVFWGCTGLTEVTIPDSVTSLGGKVFFECTGLKTVDLPANMYDLPRSFFSGCINLEQVDLPETVQSIYYAAFDDCEKLTSINKDNSLSNVSYIDARAFCGCTNLKFADPVLSQDLYNLGSEYGGYAFANCDQLTGVTIPGSVDKIHWVSFMNCDNLQEVIIEEGVRSIGSSAFTECPKLESVTLPVTVNEIEHNAFAKCSTLKDLYILSEDCTIAEPITPEHSSEKWYPLGIPGTTTIHGRPGSTAESYATQHGFTFEALPETCEYGYHKYDKTETVEATCTQHGSEEISCSVCGKPKEGGILLATGHNLVDGVCTLCGGSFIAGGSALNGSTDQYDCGWALGTDGTLTLYTTVPHGIFMGVPWAEYADQVKTLEYSNVSAYWLYYPGGDNPDQLEWSVFPNLTTVIIGPARSPHFSLSEFTAPNLSTFIVNGNSNYSVSDGLLYQHNYFSEGSTMLAGYPATLTDTQLRLPEGTGIYSSALKYADNLEKIYLSCDRILTETFDDCTNLTDLYILSEDWSMPDDRMELLGDPARITLHGVPDSVTQQYAEEFGYKFVPLTECDIKGHADPVIKNAIEATCLEAAYSGDQHCARCDELLSKGTATGEALGHLWDKGTDADGVRTYTCQRCSQTYTKPLPPEGMDVELPEDSKDLQDSILTEEEKDRVENGEPVSIYLDTTDITQIVSDAEKELIHGKLGNHKIGVYLDINLYKQIGNDHPVKVKETNGKIQISIKIPPQLLNSSKDVTRSYQVIRVHNGVAEVIEGTFDKNNHWFTFETDGFSTYAITYLDVENTEPEETTPPETTAPTQPQETTPPETTAPTQPQETTPPEPTVPDNPNVPNTGDPSSTLLWSALLIASALALAVICGKKKAYR